MVRLLSKYTEKYWGVTPWRVKYLQEVYKLDPIKTGLLTMGGDEEKIDWKNKQIIRKKIRKEHDIDSKDFLLVTGGKIDRRKNIHLLMKAIQDIKYEHIKLLIFGVPDDDMNALFIEYSDNINIRTIGWIPSDEVYNMFLAADLAVFPGTHSVLWEQAVACGLPAIFKYWEGMTHVDVGGNAILLEDPTSEKVKNTIELLITDKKQYNKMLEIAQNYARPLFFYKEIAKQSIEIENQILT
jgi:glycosyltransferase involved in cell wall biosynthesis